MTCLCCKQAFEINSALPISLDGNSIPTPVLNTTPVPVPEGKLHVAPHVPNRTAHQQQRTPAPPLACREQFTGRVAHCMTGVADHGNRGDRFPIYMSRNYEQLERWLARLRKYGGTHDLFMSLDMRIWPHRLNSAAQKEHAQHMFRDTPRINLTRLTPMLAALKPVSFEPYEQAPICSGNSTCYCKAAGYPGWWDQMAKNYACYEQVLRHERDNGVRYDWVVKIRSDWFTDMAIHEVSGAAEVLLRPIISSRTNVADGQKVWVKSWQMATCYGQADWFAAAPRHLAHTYFTMVPNATCHWMETVANEVRASDKRVRDVCPTLNERALIEWIDRSGGGKVADIHAVHSITAACQLRSRCAAELNEDLHPLWCRKFG